MASIQKSTPKKRPNHHHGLTEQQRLRRIVESFAKVSVLVIADLIADEFISGEIARVSREAPVLISASIAIASSSPAAEPMPS